MSTRLSVFDLVPVPSGSGPQTAVQNSLDLAARVERAGYHRLWHGEHHLNPGVIGYSPALTIALAGGVTSRIRLGSGAVLAGHRTSLSVAEEFGLLEATFPGRIDLGLGRAGLRKPTKDTTARSPKRNHRTGTPITDCCYPQPQTWLVFLGHHGLRRSDGYSTNPAHNRWPTTNTLMTCWVSSRPRPSSTS